MSIAKVVAMAAAVLLSISPVSVLAQWQTVSHSNEHRYEMIAVTYQDKLYVLNGFDRKINLVNSVEVFDPETNVWSMINTTEVGLQNAVTHAAYVLNGSDCLLYTSPSPRDS